MTDTISHHELDETPLTRLQHQGRLLNAVFKGHTNAPRRIGFRGELALRFGPRLADEARPPELSCEQVMAVADIGAPDLPF
ncbi:hypothetical protein AB4Y32_40640, partial [Paraburkholderia phymatum]